MTKFKISYKKLYLIEKEKNKEQEEEIKKLNEIIEELKKEKGYLCLKNGKKYEETNYNIVKYCKLNDKPFNTQKSVEELGGATSKNDLQCNFQEEKDFGIEIKKYNTPDWMQCSIKYNDETKNWESSIKSKIPLESKKVFDELLENIRIEVNTKNDKELCFPTIFIKIMNLLRNLIHDFEMIQQTLKK